MNTGRILKGYWTDSGWIYDVYWMDNGYVTRQIMHACTLESDVPTMTIFHEKMHCPSKVDSTLVVQ